MSRVRQSDEPVASGFATGAAETLQFVPVSLPLAETHTFAVETGETGGGAGAAKGSGCDA